MRNVSSTATMLLVIALVGCEKASDKAALKEVAKPAAPIKAKDDHDHKSGDEHDHGDPDNHAPKDEGRGVGHGGEVVELGTTNLGEFSVRASRDKVEFKPGGDSPIDVWIDGGTGNGVTAVRFWIGVEDAKGSMKSKAQIEDGKWHTHVEIPNPLPDDSKLWVEIEESTGTRSTISFELRM